VLHDGVRERISPNKLPVARWVEIIEASHRAGLRSTATVMFGHIEEPWELAEHMRVVRALQRRTGGFTEFVPLSFIPFHTLLGRTHGVEEISREENLKHTAAFRLALGRSVPNLQASWVKMGLDAATEALRWGVNDLGGTLMEESISRMAGSYHGVRLEPDDLVAAAHRAGRPARSGRRSTSCAGPLPAAAGAGLASCSSRSVPSRRRGRPRRARAEVIVAFSPRARRRRPPRGRRRRCRRGRGRRGPRRRGPGVAARRRRRLERDDHVVAVRAAQAVGPRGATIVAGAPGMSGTSAASTPRTLGSWSDDRYGSGA
jgi:hypothetical protein